MVLITEWRWQSTAEVKNKSLKVFQFELLNEKKLGKKINSASHVWESIRSSKSWKERKKYNLEKKTRRNFLEKIFRRNF